MKNPRFLSILMAVFFAGASVGAGWAQNIPAPDQIQALVKGTMLDFALAVKAKDFSGFYKNIAKFWQSRTSPGELAQIFKSFIDQEIDLTVLDDLEPTFAKKAALNAQGWLVVEGAYGMESSTAEFILKYLKEGSFWKLVGIEVNVAAPRPILPSPETIKEMVKATMLDLAIAIKAKDFRGFYRSIAALWQGQTTAAALAENFRSFTDQNMDLTGLQALDPVFTKEPAWDENNCLSVEGYYPSEPLRAYFVMKLLSEEGAWKLVAIDLNVTPEKN